MLTKENAKEWYSIAEAASFLGVSQDTLRRWEKKGNLIPRRTAGGHRRYAKKQLERALRTPTARTIATKRPQFQRKSHIPHKTQIRKPDNLPKTTFIYKTTHTSKQNIKRYLKISLVLIASTIVIVLAFFIARSFASQPTTPITPLPSTSESLLLP